MCSSAFCRPGTAPNIFFTAQDRPVITWVFTLGQSTMRSARASGSNTLNAGTSAPPLFTSTYLHSVYGSAPVSAHTAARPLVL